MKHIPFITKKVLPLAAYIFTLANPLHAQWKVGLQLDAYQSKLTNYKTFSDNAENSFKALNVIGGSPTITFTKVLNDQYSFSTGVGYFRHVDKFEFKLYNRNDVYEDTVLYNRFHYLTIPIMINMNVLKKQKQNILLSAGLINKILLKTNSDFNDYSMAITDFPMFGARYTLGARIEATYSYNLPNDAKIAIGPFLQTNLLDHVGNTINFDSSLIYFDLKKLNYTTYGLSIKYQLPYDYQLHK